MHRMYFVNISTTWVPFISEKLGFTNVHQYFKGALAIIDPSLERLYRLKQGVPLFLMVL